MNFPKLSTEDTVELIISVVLVVVGVALIAIQFFLKPKATTTTGAS